VPEITYLGFSVSGRGISPVETKLGVIEHWPTPETTRDVRHV
jgi:hypothetical protein